MIFPRNIGIELVRGCNFACRMCPVTANTPYERDKLQFIDLAFLEKIVAEIDRWPCIETIWFFHFGEPLAHPAYRQCLEILNRSEIARQALVIQYTNASLLRGDKAAAILEVPVIKKLVFSFDGFGDKKSFELLRGPHYDEVLKNIQDFSEKVRQQRPDLKMATCTILPRAGEVPGFLIPDREEALTRLKNLFTPLGVCVEPRDMHEYNGMDPLLIRGDKPEKIFGGCLFVEQDSIYLTVNGWAQPCCAVYQETFHVGGFSEQDFGELLNNQAMQRIRHSLRMDERNLLSFCRKCSFSIGGSLSPLEFQQFWEKRDQQEQIRDLGERRHLLAKLGSSKAAVVKLDLGCGMAKSGGFIGLDRFKLRGVDIITDLNQLLPIMTNSVDCVFASHSLEHVNDLIKVMQEIYRVCKHGAQVCVVAPYYNQGLNLANPYHKQAFNEHTPRFWTNANTMSIPASEFEHPHAISWGLAQSDHSDPGIDFRCLRIEYFYFPQYRTLPPAEQRELRRKYSDVCDQIMYHLLVIKKPTGESEVEEITKKIEYYEPPYVTIRKLQEQKEAISREVYHLQTRFEKKESELKQEKADKERLENEIEEQGRIQKELNTSIHNQNGLIQDQNSQIQRLTVKTERFRLKGIFLAKELDEFRQRKIFRWMNRLQNKTSAWDDISPAFQQLKDDSLIYNPNLKGFRLQPSLNLQRVPFLFYPLNIKRPNLQSILLAPIFDLPLSQGVLGVEIISPSSSIVAQKTIPISEIDEFKPTRFEFNPIRESDIGKFWLRVFVRDVEASVRVFEWRKYSLGGVGNLITRAFCGFIFSHIAKLASDET